MNQNKFTSTKKKESHGTAVRTFSPFLFTILLSIFINFANAVLAQSPLQNIRGTITDIDSKEPLIGAAIEIPSLNIGSTTDENGEFKITGVPVGRYDVHVTYIGYEEQTASDVIVTAGKEVIINLTLAEKVHELNEVVVAYDRTEDKTVTNNDMTVVSSRSFNIEDTKKYAGSLVDN